MKTRLKQKATKLREKGFSYSEINRRVPVSKSTLSLWLRNIKLTPDQKARLKEKIGKNQPYGAKAQREIRIKRTKKIINNARNEISRINKKELFHIGAVLYWAEGTKQKEHNPGQGVSFNNSDPLMIKIFLKWILEIVKISKERINFSIYSHDNIRHRESEVIQYWAKITGFPVVKFGKIYYKKNKKKKYRRNQGRNYYGLLRININKSTDLNRKITGWIEGVCNQCGVV